MIDSCFSTFAMITIGCLNIVLLEICSACRVPGSSSRGLDDWRTIAGFVSGPNPARIPCNNVKSPQSWRFYHQDTKYGVASENDVEQHGFANSFLQDALEPRIATTASECHRKSQLGFCLGFIFKRNLSSWARWGDHYASNVFQSFGNLAVGGARHNINMSLIFAWQGLGIYAVWLLPQTSEMLAILKLRSLPLVIFQATLGKHPQS